jgi:ribosomal protein S18 acetylase RimI-like enzyme
MRRRSTDAVIARFAVKLVTMVQPIKIRRALVADAPDVYAVLMAAKKDIPLVAFDDDKGRGLVRDKCRDRKVWVAEIDGNLAGVALLGLSIWCLPYVPEISYLATVNEYRRRDVASTLVRYAVKVIYQRDRNGVIVEVWDRNLPTIELLTKERFKPHPTRQKPKPQGQDPRPYFVTYFLGDVP